MFTIQLTDRQKNEACESAPQEGACLGDSNIFKRARPSLHDMVMLREDFKNNSDGKFHGGPRGVPS